MDPLHELHEVLDVMTGTLHELQSNARANAHDLRMLANRAQHTDETLTRLAGTVSGLGSILSRVVRDQGGTQAWRDQLEARVEALERSRPPAA